MQTEFLTCFADDSWKKDKFFNLRLINNEAKSTLEELQHEYKPSPYLVMLSNRLSRNASEASFINLLYQLLLFTSIGQVCFHICIA